MRTQDEIVKRIETRKDDDLLGFETGEYINYLDFSNARPFLKDDVTEQNWQEAVAMIGVPIKRMHAYMEFAWGKANNSRGISANRSVMHCIAWLWLAGEDDLLAQVEDEYCNYHFYGKPILEIICEHFDWDWSQWDDGIRTNG